MSATISLHPSSRDLVAAVDWGFGMVMLGYDVRAQLLPGGDMTLTARPLDKTHETARTSFNTVKRPKYHHQYHAVRLWDEPPPAA